MQWEVFCRSNNKNTSMSSSSSLRRDGRFEDYIIWSCDWLIRKMDVERSSLCNCVVNFLLEENYLLTAFELLHELLDDGRDAHAIRLKEFFSNPSQFPPDQISRFNNLRGLSDSFLSFYTSHDTILLYVCFIHVFVDGWWLLIFICSFELLSSC